jgi:hypothetical protein
MTTETTIEAPPSALDEDLKARAITYAELARELDVSWSAVREVALRPRHRLQAQTRRRYEDGIQRIVARRERQQLLVAAEVWIAAREVEATAAAVLAGLHGDGAD